MCLIPKTADLDIDDDTLRVKGLLFSEWKHLIPILQSKKANYYLPYWKRCWSENHVAKSFETLILMSHLLKNYFYKRNNNWHKYKHIWKVLLKSLIMRESVRYCNSFRRELKAPHIFSEKMNARMNLKVKSWKLNFICFIF